MPPPARRAQATTATIALMRALAALGPRLHDPLTARDPRAIYELVCETLRTCGLHAHIAELDADGTLRVAATSLTPQIRAFIEQIVGGPFIGYPLPLVGPYAEAVAGANAVTIERVVDVLAPMMPQLTSEQREQLAASATADRALLAPIVARDRVLGVLTVFGPRTLINRVDAPAVAALAAQIGIASENARLFREVEAERAQWHATVEHLVSLVVVCDAMGHFTYFNASALRAFGPPDSAKPPEAHSTTYEMLHLDGTPVRMEEIPLQRARLTGLPVPPTPMVMRGSDGAWRHCVWTANPLRGPDGAIQGAVAVGRDITHQELLERRSWQALHMILRIAELATEPLTRPLLTTEPEARLRLIVPALRSFVPDDSVHAMLVDEAAGRLVPIALSGTTPEVEAIWREEVTAFSPPSQETGGVPALWAAHATLQAGQVLHQDLAQEASLISPRTDRMLGVREVITAPVLDERQLIGLLSISRARAPDPTSPSLFTPFDEELLAGVARLVGQALSRARLSEQLVEMEAARRAAEAATRQRDMFLSVASHELRTPLTTLKMLNQLLLRRARAEQPTEGEPASPAESTASTGSARHSDYELHARMGRQLNRIIRLVDDLVESSRIETGHLELQDETCDLAALVRQVVLEQREISPVRLIALRTPPTPIWIRGDADRLQQVIANYLTNALKYSPMPQPVVVTLRATEEYALVAVRDHGPGVPPEEHERVWQRFHRVPGIPVATGSGIGLGIGLYISKTFIERHGGLVGISNPPGGGARFWFCLPRAR